MLPISCTEVVLVSLAKTCGALLVLAGGFGKTRIFDLATRIGTLMNVPVIPGAIWMVHLGRWNFVPSETYLMGGMEFQAVLLLVMLFMAQVGNRFQKEASAA
ncbi:hypothetical protein [Candidatus Halocynthiibacter alkanivorans]|uniref:hypothetical protein n=1 Tax=Candidatus Halocynthiibacter alkanivorans TaxID=2267619 RepID=UPI000DF2B413|nr:hypothetical protein [Candidatus Halocynthiibacter alkanivorans]